MKNLYKLEAEYIYWNNRLRGNIETRQEWDEINENLNRLVKELPYNERSRISRMKGWD